MNPENDYGNVEYKLILKDDDEMKLQNLATQMRYRCNQSENGECIYNLGVSDDGEFIGLTDEEYKKTLDILKKVADKNNYSVQILTTTDVKENKKIYEVLIREIIDNKYIDIKACITGSVDAGKTSLTSTLVTGQLDNGRGLARSLIFNYIHELKTGRTSSITHQILGFDYNGEVVNNQSLTKLSWSDIVNRSSKIISFFDLCGHEKYLKTTILGLSSSFPDICVIVISANNGISPMTKEHILLCITLKIPFIIALTKIDMCKDRMNVMNETIADIYKTLKHSYVRRIPLNVKNTEDILLAVKNIYNFSTTPIFHVSSVTGEGIDKLKQFFNLVGKNNNHNITKNEKTVEFHIDHLFYVQGFGTVVGGHLISGNVKVGDKLLIGPYNNEYHQVVIRSIYCKKVPLQNVSFGSYVCLGIKMKQDIKIKQGNVIISNDVKQICVKKFKAYVTVFRTHSTTIRVGYEPLFHAYSIRKVVKIVGIENKKNSRNTTIDDKVLRSNDTADVIFQFKHGSQFLKNGTSFIISEGKCKIYGEVVEILS
jgi:GTPase